MSCAALRDGIPATCQLLAHHVSRVRWVGVGWGSVWGSLEACSGAAPYCNHAAHHVLRYAVLCQAAGDYEERSKKVLKKWGTYISVLAKGDLLATAKG